MREGGDVRAYFRDHVVGARVAGEVDEHVDALLLNALGNGKLAPAVEQAGHVEEAFD